MGDPVAFSVVSRANRVEEGLDDGFMLPKQVTFLAALQMRSRDCIPSVLQVSFTGDSGPTVLSSLSLGASQKAPQFGQF